MEKENSAGIKKKCVFIGRFQPMHNGHLEVIKWVLAQGSELSIVIGSLQEYGTKNNPLGFFERKKMLERVLAAEGITGIKIFGLPDFYNNIVWGRKLLEITNLDPQDTSVVTLNPWPALAANTAGFVQAKHPVFFNGLSGTIVREKIFKGENWEDLVPAYVSSCLKETGGIDRIRISQIPLAERIADFISGSVKRSKTRGAVLAVSGGIDSALVAAIAKKALGKKVQFVFLPFFKNCPFRKNVLILEKALKIQVKRIHLEKVMDAYVLLMPRGGNLAYGNLKPRIRMAVVYYLANFKKLLVLGTTNRSEMEIGYFTKYGDGGVDIEPIADLYKTEVFELAKELKIPAKIIETAPTAALWPGQTDEKELGVAYLMLDTILKMANLGFERSEILRLTGIKEEKFDKIMARKAGNAHKLAVPPVCKLK